jgi:hypothetical protein
MQPIYTPSSEGLFGKRMVTIAAAWLFHASRFNRYANHGSLFTDTVNVLPSLSKLLNGSFPPREYRYSIRKVRLIADHGVAQ